MGGDLPDDVAGDGGVNGRFRHRRARRTATDEPGGARAQHRLAIDLDEERALADGEQTLADADQTLADADQTSSDSDQTSADRDRWAADRDQAAGDRDLGDGAAPRAHEFSRDVRDDTARRREAGAQARLAAAAQRDAVAESRDLAATTRDRTADARDLELARDVAHDNDTGSLGRTGADLFARAAVQRKRAAPAQLRARDAEQRALAAQDREAAAQDRKEAARERLHALADRQLIARRLAVAEIDPLTGARTRAAGLIDLDHELDRARRTGGALVVAYIDVVGLKSVNDSEGHRAGDELIKRIVILVRQHLRPCDLVIRVGGDEFLFVMNNMTLADAVERFSSIASALAAAPGAGAITTGFAQLLSPQETAAELIARAGEELSRARRRDVDTRRPATSSAWPPKSV